LLIFRRDSMGFWDRVMGRLSVPGLLLLTAGVVLVLQAAKLCRLVLRDNGERVIPWVKVLGLVLAVLGSVILLDWIPGL